MIKLQILKVGNYVMHHVAVLNVIFSNSKWFKLRDESLHNMQKVHFTAGFEVLSKDDANLALVLVQLEMQQMQVDLAMIGNCAR